MAEQGSLTSGVADRYASALFELALSEGAMGGQAVRWALERGKLPGRLEPKTPLRFAARRVAWQGGALEADAQVDFEAGPQLEVTLAWTPKLLELRRVALKDAASDAVLRHNAVRNEDRAQVLIRAKPAEEASLNDELRAVNFRLRQDLGQAQRASADVQALEALVDLKRTTRAETAAAHVIASSINAHFRVNRIRIDRGAEHVAVGMPVISAEAIAPRSPDRTARIRASIASRKPLIAVR